MVTCYAKFVTLELSNMRSVISFSETLSDESEAFEAELFEFREWIVAFEEAASSSELS